MPAVTWIEPDTEQIVRAVAHGEGCTVTTAARASMRGVVFTPFAEPAPATSLGRAL